MTAGRVRLFRTFREDRALLARSASYADALMCEPSTQDVAWLVSVATHGDADHAQWELRYLRRALGVLVAQRHALDDRTHSEVLRALLQRMSRDPNVDADLRDLGERQFNARLSAYRDAFVLRGIGTPAIRISQNLLAFSGGPIRTADPVVKQGGTLVDTYLDSTHESLRQAFGTAELPDDLRPSQAAR